MFATLLGGLPRPPVEAGQDPLAVAVRAQEEAGLEPVTDGRLRDPGFDRLAGLLLGPGGTDEARTATLEAWRSLAGATDRATKQALPGPYSLGWRDGIDPADRAPRTLAAAETLAAIVAALGEAGCPLVDIEEAEAHRIRGDDAERRLFREAHRRLTERDEGDEGDTRGGAIHRSLSIVGGAAAGAGIETILDAPYSSLAVDLIAGPDDWNLVTRLRGDRGVIVGVQAAGAEDQSNEEMLWAAQYAASTQGRGIARVGLGSAGSYANLTWDAAVRKMQRLGGAARLASLPPGEIVRALDPRAVSIRRAALGHNAPPPPRRRRKPNPGRA